MRSVSMTEGIWEPAPRLMELLHSEGTTFKDHLGDTREAVGTGIIPIVGSARSGKTALAYALIEWVIENTKRPIALLGLPDKALESIPEEWRDRVSNPEVEKMVEFKRPAVCLLDDTAVILNSRDSGTNFAKYLSRIAGVISHIGGGLTLILTTQSMSGIDLSLTRYTNLASVVRFVDRWTLRTERTSWVEDISHAQSELEAVSRMKYLRDVYYSLHDDLICYATFPEFYDDVLSRPYQYMSKDMRKRIILRAKDSKKKRVDEDEQS